MGDYGRNEKSDRGYLFIYFYFFFITSEVFDLLCKDKQHLIFSIFERK
jgi:hypothetical protein